MLQYFYNTYRSVSWFNPAKASLEIFSISFWSRFLWKQGKSGKHVTSIEIKSCSPKHAASATSSIFASLLLMKYPAQTNFKGRAEKVCLGTSVSSLIVFLPDCMRMLGNHLAGKCSSKRVACLFRDQLNWLWLCMTKTRSNFLHICTYCNFSNFRCTLNFGNFSGQQFYRIQNDTERE